MIHFQCHQCGKRLKTPDKYAGRPVQCSACGAVQTVPAAPEPMEATRTQVYSPSELGFSPPPPPPPVEEPAFRPRTEMTDDGLDMTPMVDVTFLLLIFFMVTAAFALQKSITIPTPDPNEAATESRSIEDLEDDDDYIIVRIDKDSTIWVNESEAPSQQELLAQLKEAREGPPGTAGEGPSKLLVMASGDALHEKVVMALDAGTAAGIDDVRLATGEDEF